MGVYTADGVTGGRKGADKQEQVLRSTLTPDVPSCSKEVVVGCRQRHFPEVAHTHTRECVDARTQARGGGEMPQGEA